MNLQINQTRRWFFEKINKIDKSLTRLTRGNRDSILKNKIRNEKGDITTESEEVKKNHQIILQKPILIKTGKPG
jgi:UDP-2,3-diacylglucosamine pyrophosphatase LpxH